MISYHIFFSEISFPRQVVLGILLTRMQNQTFYSELENVTAALSSTIYVM